MRRLFGLLTIAFVVALASAGLAGATTTVAWSATFHELVTTASGHRALCAGHVLW